MEVNTLHLAMYIVSRFLVTITLLGKRKLFALLKVCSWCARVYVSVRACVRVCSVSLNHISDL